MENIEIKHRVPDLDRVRESLDNLPASRIGDLQQTDTYFVVTSGRLKLRDQSGPGEERSASLIAYIRPDDSTSRVSQYHLLPVAEPDALRAMLTDTLGVLTVVRKHRELFISGQTRIHLDTVDGLGTFVELETVIDGPSGEQAWDEHRFVRANLALDEYEPVEFSYSDLILQGTDPQST